jgi:hypothetical protein
MVQEQPIQILAVLLEQAGQIVSREELQRRLWPEGTFVDRSGAEFLRGSFGHAEIDNRRPVFLGVSMDPGRTRPERIPGRVPNPGHGT